MSIQFDDYKKYDDIIKARLKPQRYDHSKNVALAAAELAKKYNYDVNRAYLAGLLHDICKNDTNEKLLKYCEEFGIILDNLALREPKMWHAIVGAAYIENVLKIDDDEIVSAVRYHTTGKENMSVLEQIIYLADCISVERDFDGVDKIRKAVDKSLDYGMYVALGVCIEGIAQHGRLIHTDSVMAYNPLAEKFGYN